MGGRLAFHGIVGGEDDFFHDAILRTFEQAIQMDFPRSDTVQRR